MKKKMWKKPWWWILWPGLVGAETLVIDPPHSEVRFEAEIFAHGDLGRFFHYRSSHGDLYSDQGWGMGQRIIANLPGVLPFGFQSSMAARFKTYPHPSTYADNLQIVASDIGLGTPNLYGFQLWYEVLVQSYSAHQVPAPRIQLSYEREHLFIQAAHYQ